jgi:hypothetical protein
LPYPWEGLVTNWGKDVNEDSACGIEARPSWQDSQGLELGLLLQDEFVAARNPQAVANAGEFNPDLPVPLEKLIGVDEPRPFLWLAGFYLPLRFALIVSHACCPRLEKWANIPKAIEIWSQ